MGANSSKLATVCLAAALCAGCGGSGVGLDSNGRPIDPGGSETGPLTADFKSIQDHVFTPICTVCHAGASAPQGLRLDAVNSYGLLVGIPSTEVPSILRVAAGHPDNSYIIQKLEGHASVGARMPFGGPYLDAATIGVIRQWILDGARPPAPAVVADARAVSKARAHRLLASMQKRWVSVLRPLARDDESRDVLTDTAAPQPFALLRAARLSNQRIGEGWK